MNASTQNAVNEAGDTWPEDEGRFSATQYADDIRDNGIEAANAALCRDREHMRVVFSETPDGDSLFDRYLTALGAALGGPRHTPGPMGGIYCRESRLMTESAK